MKATIEKLKIIVVYAIKHERQQNMFTGRTSDIAIPQGNVHIFQIVNVEDGLGAKVTEPSRYAFCGKTRAEIGERTKDSDKRPNGLPMCTKCEAAWKEHPDSPWRAWEKSTTP